MPLHIALGMLRNAQAPVHTHPSAALRVKRAAARTARVTSKADGHALRRTRVRKPLRRKWNLVTFCRLCDTAASNVRATCYALHVTISEKITWRVLIAALMRLYP